MRGQVDCDEGTEAGLDIGQKKREPIEAARARRRIRSARRLRRRWRREGAIGTAIERTAGKLECKR
jgi:hypothetical protein